MASLVTMRLIILLMQPGASSSGIRRESNILWPDSPGCPHFAKIQVSSRTGRKVRGSKILTKWGGGKNKTHQVTSK